MDKWLNVQIYCQTHIDTSSCGESFLNEQCQDSEEDSDVGPSHFGRMVVEVLQGLVRCESK